MPVVRFFLGAVVLVAALGGCTSGNSAIEPPFQSVNVSQIGKLQFSVGTANIMISPSGGVFVGLNTVVTFRKANGTSAFAVNTPVITGPAGFVVPKSGQAGADAGTSHISGTPQLGSTVTTFGTSGQATLYGFGPNNYGPSGSFPPGNYALPFYADVMPGYSSSSPYPQTTFYGVPPAFPPSSIITGYNLGFVDFAAKAVSGTYQLAVTVPVSPGSSQQTFTYTASASMNAARPLPDFLTATFTPDKNGGGTVNIGLPPGATEAYAQLNDTTSGAIFGFAFHSSTSQTLPDGSLSSGDGYSFVAVAFDYPALEAAAPKSTVQTPKIVGPSGQDDVTVTYPQTGSAP
ncbi:MAG: hypothetical protein JO060_08105 [Candidatus Eremiobacteraeota bacterium]|nr:hypothetical protein [Candidatus Eremiobacteraeota bacterium]